MDLRPQGRLAPARLTHRHGGPRGGRHDLGLPRCGQRPDGPEGRRTALPGRVRPRTGRDGHRRPRGPLRAGQRHDLLDARPGTRRRDRSQLARLHPPGRHRAGRNQRPAHHPRRGRIGAGRDAHPPRRRLGALGVRRRRVAARRQRGGALRARPDGRHHRAQAARGAARARGDPRPADRPPEPAAVPAPRRAGRGARVTAGVARRHRVPRPRRLQARQRHVRPLGRRRAPRPGRRTAARLDPRGRQRGPLRR